jgi:hypothetical protein
LSEIETGNYKEELTMPAKYTTKKGRRRNTMDELKGTSREERGGKTVHTGEDDTSSALQTRGSIHFGRVIFFLDSIFVLLLVGSFLVSRWGFVVGDGLSWWGRAYGRVVVTFAFRGFGAAFRGSKIKTLKRKAKDFLCRQRIFKRNNIRNSLQLHSRLGLRGGAFAFLHVSTKFEMVVHTESCTKFNQNEQQKER